MAELTIVAATLKIKIDQRSDFPILLDADINLTGYTFAAAVVQFCGGDEVAFTITETDLSAGQVSINLTDTQIDALEKDVDHKWYYNWTTGGYTTPIVKGPFRVNS